MVLNVLPESINNTIGENGMVPSREVSEILASFLILIIAFQQMKLRLQSLAITQAEMNTILVQINVITALD